MKNINITWVADTYAYRHANSDDVTVIVIHSGVAPKGMELKTTTKPPSALSDNYPTTYATEVEIDKRYTCMFIFHITRNPF